MATTTKQRTIPQPVLERIAKERLFLETIETRGTGSLDFSEQAVWTLVDALDEAYIAGLAAGLKAKAVKKR